MPVIDEAPLEEREREVEILRAALERASGGEGAGVLVEGPPGIGKTRVLSWARRHGGDERTVLAARASELEREFAFAVVRQLLEPLLRDGDHGALLAGAAALAEPVLVGGEVTEPAVALHGLYWLVANLAAQRPVLVLVDDAHWADAPSLRWLAYLAQRLEGLPLTLVAACRPAEATEARDVFDALAANPAIEVVHPAALGTAGVGRVVERALGRPAAPEFVAACRAVTGGNPFLLGELVRELAAAGVAPVSENAGVVSRQSSRTVSRAALARLRRLPAAANALARAIAVLGDGADLGFAARLAGLEADAASAAADMLAAGWILAPGRPLAFAHPLVRASVYADLPAGERARAHARAAELLRAGGAAADRIAVHAHATDPCGDERTVEVLRAAAADGRRRGATDVAVSHLKRALREPPPAALEPSIRRELGSAELHVGQIEAAVQHLTDALQDTPEPAQRAAVALELAGGLMFTERALDAVDMLTDAIADLGDRDGELAARLVMLRTLVGWTSLEARRHVLALPEPRLPVVETPRTTGERSLLARRALDELFTGSAERARSLALGALGDGELVAAVGAHDPAWYLSIAALIWSHGFADAERHCHAALDDARRRGSEMAFATASNFRAALRGLRGMLAELEADARAALASRIALVGNPQAAVALAEALAERGQPEAAMAELRAFGLDASTPPEVSGGMVLAARARIKLAEQRPDDALALLLECGEHEEAWDLTPSLTNWRADAAVLLVQLGDLKAAGSLAGEAVRRAERFGSPVARGIALRAAALAAQPADLDRLAASVALSRAGGARLELARSLVELGAALRRSGRKAQARDQLREGFEVAAECGAAVLARRAHDELVAAGAKPRRDPITSRSTLTASELRVARMAAEGLTNREIAQALFLTEKTIEFHLSGAYRKLDIASRSQLARALAPI